MSFNFSYFNMLIISPTTNNHPISFQILNIFHSCPNSYIVPRSVVRLFSCFHKPASFISSLFPIPWSWMKQNSATKGSVSAETSLKSAKLNADIIIILLLLFHSSSKHVHGLAAWKFWIWLLQNFDVSISASFNDRATWCLAELGTCPFLKNSHASRNAIFFAFYI